MQFLSAVAAMTSGDNPISRQEALLKVGNYQSRGKGHGETKKARHGKHMDVTRAAKKRHNQSKRG